MRRRIHTHAHACASVPISLDSPRSTAFLVVPGALPSPVHLKGASPLLSAPRVPPTRHSPSPWHIQKGAVSISADSPRGRELSFADPGRTQGCVVSAIHNPAVSMPATDHTRPVRGRESVRSHLFVPTNSTRAEVPFEYPSVHLDTWDSILPTPSRPPVSCLLSSTKICPHPVFDLIGCDHL